MIVTSETLSQSVRDFMTNVSNDRETSVVGSFRGVVYLMRGLPACGKSTTARRLAGEHGVVLETDAFFYAADGTYDFDTAKLDQARDWVFREFQSAINSGTSTIVVDRGNGLNPETQRFAMHAINSGYDVKIREPDSPWWHEIQTLLRYRPHTEPALEAWARELANISKRTHHVPYRTIRGWMDSWVSDVTIEEILEL